MPRELREVWVVRAMDGEILCITEDPAHKDLWAQVPSVQDITHHTLLTERDAAVLAAAESYEKSHGKYYDYARANGERKSKDHVIEAVRARRQGEPDA